jgi:hypothetical protein
MSLSSIVSEQISGAGTRHRSDHILDHLEDNLFFPLRPATYAVFAKGSGDELGLGGRTAKMRSLRSSSVLACNVFDTRRGHVLWPLALALEAEDQFMDMAFEQKVPHSLGSFPPNLDVMLCGHEISPLGIEAKFAEPYEHETPRPVLADKYFPSGRQRWAVLGLPRSQALVEAIGRSEHFTRLDAGQLVKHILGLATIFPQYQTIRLRYVWFDASGVEDNIHRKEIAEFAHLLGSEVDFAAIRYQELYARLASSPEPEPGYLAYLKQRYFST